MAQAGAAVTIGSLFSGIGGLELGLERAGLGPVLWQCEIDPYCRAVLAKHWPDATRYPDVRRLRGAELFPVDVVCGGFPCQDISQANPGGAGLDGDRSGLWFEFLRIIDEHRPRAVVVENVGRLLRRGLDVVATGLDDLGYRVEFARIRAADVGAPHLRERLFIVADALSGGRGSVRDWPAPDRRTEPGGGGPQLANPDGRGLEGEWEPEYTGVGGARRDLADGRDPGGRRIGEDRATPPPEPSVGGAPDGVPVRLDGPGPGGAWPALRGQPQFAWEPPRTIRQVSDRRARLASIGNAVVHQVAIVVGMRVRERTG